MADLVHLVAFETNRTNALNIIKFFRNLMIKNTVGFRYTDVNCRLVDNMSITLC